MVVLVVVVVMVVVVVVHCLWIRYLLVKAYQLTHWATEILRNATRVQGVGPSSPIEKLDNATSSEGIRGHLGVTLGT